jgi:hypothetical protein
MNETRLQKLQDRAKQAVEIADKIRALNDASPYTGSRRLNYGDLVTGGEVLKADLLKQVIEAGRVQVLADLEQELTEIISVEPVITEEAAPTAND